MASKNRALHHGIKRSPYEAMFGEKARSGLSSSFLPEDVVRSLETEEDLERALNEFSVATHQRLDENFESDLDSTYVSIHKASDQNDNDANNETDNIQNLEVIKFFLVIIITFQNLFI